MSLNTQSSTLSCNTACVSEQLIVDAPIRSGTTAPISLASDTDFAKSVAVAGQFSVDGYMDTKVSTLVPRSGGARAARSEPCDCDSLIFDSSTDSESSHTEDLNRVKKNLIAKKNLQVDKSAQVQKDLEVCKSLDVCEDATFSQNLTICGDLIVTGKIITEARFGPNCDATGITRYVRAAPGSSGTGTLNDPWTTLALAQSDVTWETLIILYSKTELDGGIVTRPGTKLIGQGPNGCTKSAVKPVITNTTVSAAIDEGNGVYITNGNVCIQNIWIKDTQKAAIFSNVSNGSSHSVTLIDVLITGHNKGNHLIDLTSRGPQAFYPFPPTFETGALRVIPGVLTVTNGSGNNLFHSLTIKDNFTGSGVLEWVYGGATRTTTANYCLYTRLQNQTPDTDGLIFNDVSAMDTYANEVGTTYTLNVNECEASDYIENVISSGINIPSSFNCSGWNGAVATANIDKCKVIDFVRKTPDIRGIAAFLFGWSSNYSFSILNPGVNRSVVNYNVSNSEFSIKEVIPGNRVFISGDLEVNSDTNLSFSNNKFINISNGVELNDFFLAARSTSWTNNQFFNLDRGLVVEQYFGGAPFTQTVNVDGNYFIGEEPLVSLAFDYSSTPVTETWTITDNCNTALGRADAVPTSYISVATFNPGTPFTSRTFNASNNNIIGFDSDLLEIGGTPGGTYNIANNYWGGGAPVINAPSATVVSTPFLTTEIPEICDVDCTPSITNYQGAGSARNMQVPRSIEPDETCIAGFPGFDVEAHLARIAAL